MLSLRCPSPKCGVVAREELVRPLLDAEQQVKYDTFKMRSFVEGNIHVRWRVARPPTPACPIRSRLTWIDYLLLSLRREH